MQRSYLVKSSVNFADFGFFVKVGDILVHDPANGNKLTVYRSGKVIRDVKQTSLGLAAMVKNSVLVEVVGTAQTPTAAPKTPAKPIPVPPKPKLEVPKEESKPKKEASAVNWGGVDMSTKPKAEKEEKKAPKPTPKPKPVEIEIEDETI